MNIQLRDMYLKSYSYCCYIHQRFYFVERFFLLFFFLLDTSLSFANIYISALLFVYIHVAALRSAAVSAAAFSECLAFCTRRGTLDKPEFCSAVPIVEIWDSLYRCSEFPAGIKILFVFSFVLSVHNFIAHQNVHAFITLILRLFVCVFVDGTRRCDNRSHSRLFIFWLSHAKFLVLFCVSKFVFTFHCSLKEIKLFRSKTLCEFSFFALNIREAAVKRKSLEIDTLISDCRRLIIPFFIWAPLMEWKTP